MRRGIAALEAVEVVAVMEWTSHGPARPNTMTCGLDAEGAVIGSCEVRVACGETRGSQNFEKEYLAGYERDFQSDIYT